MLYRGRQDPELLEQSAWGLLSQWSPLDLFLKLLSSESLTDSFNCNSCFSSCIFIVFPPLFVLWLICMFIAAFVTLFLMLTWSMRVCRGYVGCGSRCFRENGCICIYFTVFSTAPISCPSHCYSYSVSPGNAGIRLTCRIWWQSWRMHFSV